MADDFGNTALAGRTLVMGTGNLLMGDDGVGAHAIRELGKVKLPDTVELLDAGTAFMDAIPHMAGIDRLIVIDAVEGGKEPGTVYRIQVNCDSYSTGGTSIHGLSVIDVMKLFQCSLPETVVVLGIEPEVIDWRMGISETVSKSMPLLIDRICSEINNGGGALNKTEPIHSEFQ